MKAYFFVILLGALAMYSCDVCSGTASSVSDCEKKDIPTGVYRCCFVDFKVTAMGATTETKGCAPITKDQYDNIEKYMEDAKKQMEAFGAKIDKYDVDCNSNYIIISMLALLLLFL